MADNNAKKPPYRPLNIKERDMLFAFYEKWNGNMSGMVLDKECIFKAYNQIRYYARLYNFHEQLIEKRHKRAEEVINGLKDAKVRALENAVRMLEPHHRFVFSKTGVQIFDTDGNPQIIETLPYYKELKTAWEIIKAELGEPIMVSKSDITSKGERLSSINVHVVHGAKSTGDDGIRTELPQPQEDHGQPGGNGKQ